MCTDMEDLYLEWEGKRIPLHKSWEPGGKPGSKLAFCKRGGMRVAEPPSWRPGAKVKFGILRRTQP